MGQSKSAVSRETGTWLDRDGLIRKYHVVVSLWWGTFQANPDKKQDTEL